MLVGKRDRRHSAEELAGLSGEQLRAQGGGGGILGMLRDGMLPSRQQFGRVFIMDGFFLLIF